MPIETPGDKKSVPEGLWTKCLKCEAIIYNKELDENFKVCSKCGYHFRLSVPERLALLLDQGSFKEWDEKLSLGHPKAYSTITGYAEKLKESQKKTTFADAVVAGEGMLEGRRVMVAILAFEFMGGSMGSVVGEKVTRTIEAAAKKRLPLLIVSASGGARMQEGIASLMQMAKTSAALAQYHKLGLPYISVVTDPTTGGVSASFAMLGDIIVAEPMALVAFAGPRVIRETLRQELPEGFQQAEFLLAHGMVDLIAERKDLKKTLARLLDLFLKNTKIS